MRPRHPKLPKRWLMTDERIADLDAAVARLRRGDGIVFRHHATPLAERRQLFAQVLRVAKRRGLVLVRAGEVAMRGEMGVHGAGRMIRPGVRTWAAHSRIEAVAGMRAGADALFVSPVFATHSHPGGQVLGAMHAAAIGRGLRATLVALGGMDARRFSAITRLGFDSWAAIDAFSSTSCKRKLASYAIRARPR